MNKTKRSTKKFKQLIVAAKLDGFTDIEETCPLCKLIEHLKGKPSPTKDFYILEYKRSPALKNTLLFACKKHVRMYLDSGWTEYKD